MEERLQARSKPANDAKEPAAPAVTPPAKPAVTPPVKPVEAPKPGEPIKPAEPPKPADDLTPSDPKNLEVEVTDKAGVKQKVNPWKMYEAEKARAKELEARLAETAKKLPDEAATKAREERFTQAEKRRQELEDEIRFVNYSKSQEFVDKYQKPYDQQWNKAMSELGEITVVDGDGGERPIVANDILELVNLPLGKAKEIATEKFGDFASDVMQHRKEIRNLFEAKSNALKEAKDKGAEREKMTMEQRQQQHKEMSDTAKEVWEKTIAAAKQHPEVGKIFTPDESDAEAIQKLNAGYEFVDNALGVNPFDPALTKEQRAKAVEAQAVVRNRAAAFGRLRAMLAKADADRAALHAELEQYKSSTPGTVPGARPAPVTPTATSGGALKSAADRLMARAK
jgi:hypothetical protein